MDIETKSDVFHKDHMCAHRKKAIDGECVWGEKIRLLKYGCV